MCFHVKPQIRGPSLQVQATPDSDLINTAGGQIIILCAITSEGIGEKFAFPAENGKYIKSLSDF